MTVRKAARYVMNCGFVDACVMGFKSPAEIDEGIERGQPRPQGLIGSYDRPPKQEREPETPMRAACSPSLFSIAPTVSVDKLNPDLLRDHPLRNPSSSISCTACRSRSV
jgi:hypothetical protein